METMEVKPRFRFKHRSAGRYFWEPVNDEARAVMMTEKGSTGVRWFWGDRMGLDVTVAAHDRAGELGMTPAQYGEHVRGLRDRRVTAEELAELIPSGSWPAGMTSPVISAKAFREMDREHLQYLSGLPFSRGGYDGTGGVLPPASPAPDSVPVLLSAGSYEVPESVLRRYGRAFLDRLNGSRA